MIAFDRRVRALDALQISEQGSAHDWNFGITGDWRLPAEADGESFLSQSANALDLPL